MKKILTFITLSLVLFLTGCHVEDQNGEDNYELATYTLEDVKNNNVKKNTIIVDTEAVSQRAINCRNMTIAHECIHACLHRKAFNFARTSSTSIP